MEQTSSEPVKFAQKIRPLHWVIKVSNLKRSMELLSLFGARVLRHEEFEAGCEATCNGPYSGYWSKSMVGFDIEDTSFVFELTFNYGINKYARGNDLQAIHLHKFNKDGEDMEEKLLKDFEGAAESKTDGVYRLINDDFVFKFVESKATSNQLIEGLTLNVTDMPTSLQFWSKIGLIQEKDTNSFGFDGYDYFKLHLNKVDAIDRAEAFGRIAIGCADEDVQNVFEKSGAKVQNEPITLKTEGKADVVVTILQSPDDQEICFVNETGFRDLSKETGEKVDWERYDKLN